jgi:hypothetical protein
MLGHPAPDSEPLVQGRPAHSGEMRGAAADRINAAMTTMSTVTAPHHHPQVCRAVAGLLPAGPSDQTRSAPHPHTRGAN